MRTHRARGIWCLGCLIAPFYSCFSFLFFHSAMACGVIISIAPFFTALLACFFLHEAKPSPRFFLGFLIAMAGIFMLSFRDETALRLSPLGDVLAVAAAVIWAAYSTLTKKISGFGYPVIPATRRVFFYGLLFMVPVLFLTDFHLSPARFYDASMLGNLLFLGLGASALCFVTWSFAVKALGPVKTTVYIYLVPVITAVTSAAVLGERMTPLAICGAVLTLAGLFLSGQRKKQ